ncbi:hypothetical protein BOX15_Mlig006526g4 [Macrostomum lignano]|uniref:FERM domain-containing protein n=1 Tax=Macrostomum lignano TaxID=282301 RepID=A0A267FLZ3_9PLAT|nr:hypothetical protein BOX15_Mlig006526g4 [Macrostomum lignano]
MPSLLKKLHLPTKKKEESIGEFQCIVSLLHEDKPLEFKFHVDTLGEGIFEKVCEVIGNLQEKDYFGLRYRSDDQQRRWLENGLPAYKQLKHLSPIVVTFRVKHYPPHPTDNLKQELSKYLLFCQLKRDLLHGRLYSVSSNDVIFLAACIVQAEFGDFDEIEDYEENAYLSGVTLIHNQTPKIETRIYEEHRNLKGKSVQEVEAMFLSKAFSLDTYGIDPKPVRDRNGNTLHLGLAHNAIVTFHGSRLTHSFPWENVNSIQFNDKMLLLDVNLSREELTNSTDFKYKKRHLLGFKCESRAAASALWAWSLEQQMFYTLNKGTEARVMKAKAGLFKQRHSSFRFSGRSQKELLSNSDYFLNINHTAPGFVRHSRREQAQADGRGQTDSRYATFPRRSKPDGAGDASTSTPRRTPLDDGAVGGAAAASGDDSVVLVHDIDRVSRGGDLESGIENTIAEEAEAEAEAEAAAAEDVFRDKDVDSGVAEETIVSTAAAAAVLPNNHDGEADEAFSELDKVLDQVDGQAQAGGDKPDRLADKTAVQRPPSRSRCPRLRALFLLSIGFSLLAVLGAVVLFELGEPPEPLRWLRSHPVAHDVHERFYAPARTRLMEIGASAVARLR